MNERCNFAEEENSARCNKAMTQQPEPEFASCPILAPAGKTEPMQLAKATDLISAPIAFETSHEDAAQLLPGSASVH